METHDSLDEDIAAALSGLGLEEDSTPAEGTLEDETPDEDENPEDSTEEETDEDAEDSDEDAEDEEDSEDDSDEEDDEEGDEEEDEPLQLDDEAVIVLPDGTEVSGADLKGGILRQKDYTRKTQELAQQREQVQEAIDAMEDWYEERSQDPSAWIAEIAQGTPNAHETIAQALVGTGNANVAFASITKTLVESGALDERLVEKLGLTEIAQQATSVASEGRVEALERELQELKQGRTAETEQQAALAELDRQWQGVVTKEGLQFESPEEAQEAQFELYQFMLDNGISSLDIAWDALARRQALAAPAAPAKKASVKKRATETVARKKRAAVVTRKSTGGKTSASPKTDDLNAAADAAYEAVFGGQ